MAAGTRPHGLSPLFPHARKGLSLVEIVVSLGILILFATAFVALVGTNYGRLQSSRDQSQASLLAQEGVNAVRNMAARDWGLIEDVSQGETRGLAKDPDGLFIWNGTEDATAASATLVFTRTISIDPIYRDADDDAIVETPASSSSSSSSSASSSTGIYEDLSSRFVTVTISWQNEAGNDVSITSNLIVTRWVQGSVIFDLKADVLGEGTNAAQFHNTAAVQELFNGEVRTRAVGDMQDPLAATLQTTIGSIADEGDPVDIALDGDDLFVATANWLRRYSLADISNGDMTLIASAQSANPIRSMAISDDYVFTGHQDNGTISRIHRSVFDALQENWNDIDDTWQDIGDFVNPSAIQSLLYNESNNTLLVGRSGDESGADHFEFQIINAANATGIGERNLGSETVIGLATDGGYAYVATASTVYVIDIASDPIAIQSSFNPFLSVQTISDIRIRENYLYIVGSAHSSSAEMVRRDISDPDTIGTFEYFDFAAVGATALFTADTIEWAAVALDDDSVAFMNTAGVLTSRSSISVPTISNSNCRGIAYEKDRLFYLCASTSNVILTIIESNQNPVAYAEWASYTSPVICITDVTALAWDKMAFKDNGTGYVELYVRSATGATAIVNKPWGSAYADDTQWHDISSLNPDPVDPPELCAQIRAVFQASRHCPLYLESAILTYK